MYKIIPSPQPAVNDHLESFTGELLSTRELQIVMMLFSGLTQSEIARDFNRSRNTIRNHVANACKKTGKCSTIELINWYINSILLLEYGRTFEQIATEEIIE